MAQSRSVAPWLRTGFYASSLCVELRQTLLGSA